MMYWQKEIETMPLEDMKALQSERLVAQVKHVYENVPYYREKMDAAHVKPEDIQAQLILTREAKDVLDLARDIPIEKIPDFAKLRERNEYFVEEELVDIAKSMRTSRIVYI